LVFLLLFAVMAPLHAKSRYAVLKACFEKGGAPFLISTKDKALGEKERLQQVKDTAQWTRKMKVLLDYQQIFSFKPVSDHCIAISRIPEGSHSIQIDFKSVQYTTIVVPTAITKKYKPDMLYETKIVVEEGPFATVEIAQERDRVTLYQAVDDQPVPDCTRGCAVPTDIPLYFMTKGDDEKVPCPVQFELVLRHERDRALSCYDSGRIADLLKDAVREIGSTCRVNIEYAYFRVYGDGCLVTLEPDASGLRSKDPEIRLLPLDKQKLRYFLQAGGREKRPYIFSNTDRKGEVLTPKAGDTIVLTEVRE
jgi:hypothetical protein